MVDELLSEAKKSAQLSPAMHRFYEGKMQVIPKCAIRGIKDFDFWYTPGIAATCCQIRLLAKLINLGFYFLCYVCVYCEV